MITPERSRRTQLKTNNERSPGAGYELATGPTMTQPILDNLDSDPDTPLSSNRKKIRTADREPRGRTGTINLPVAPDCYLAL